MRKYLLVISLFLSLIGQAQKHQADLFAPTNESFNDRLGPSTTKFDFKFHSSVRPYRMTDLKISDQFGFDGYKKKIYYSNFNSFDTLSKKYGVMLYPVADLNAGYDVSSNSRFVYGLQAGVGLKGNLSRMFTYDVRYSYEFGNGRMLEDSIFATSGNRRGMYSSVSNQFHNVDARLNFSPVKEFSMQIGYGKNFLGEGHRSLFLDNHASAYPFMKLQTRVWKIEYTNIFAWHREPINLQPNGPQRNKFTSTHYLSYNIFKGFNLSVFETVIWQAKDTLFNRGYDITYLNPIIFFRPLEYAQGSSDNVILGLALSYKFLDKYMLYTQFVLDEFLLREVLAGNKWWANKFGIQAGFKGYDIGGVKGLGFRSEFNWVRPFTYAHINNQMSYGHRMQPLAHPLGANFMELTNRISYVKNRWQVSLDVNYNAKGYDNSDTLSFGGDVNVSYELRGDDYNHLMLQGNKINRLIINGSVGYLIYPEINLYAAFDFGVYNSFQPSNNSTDVFFNIGIRTGLWQRNLDY